MTNLRAHMRDHRRHHLARRDYRQHKRRAKAMAGDTKVARKQLTADSTILVLVRPLPDGSEHPLCRQRGLSNVFGRSKGFVVSWMHGFQGFFRLPVAPGCPWSLLEAIVPLLEFCSVLLRVAIEPPVDFSGALWWLHWIYCGFDLFF